MRRTPFDGLRIQEAEIPWLAQRLIALRLPAILKASSGEAGLSPALQQRLSLKSALVVPLATRGRFLGLLWRSEERRVGKEGRWLWVAGQQKEKEELR